MPTPSFNTMRTHMVQSQLVPNQVSDHRLIKAFSNTPRELFVPKDLANLAYSDSPLKIAPDHFLLDPMTLGRMIQGMNITLEDIVLVVAWDRGYTAAIVTQLAGAVFVLESSEAHAQQTLSLLPQAGASIASVITGNPTDGYPVHAPYNAILIAGMVDEIPLSVLDQLNEAGRLGVIKRSHPILGEICIMQRFGKVFGEQIVCEAQAPMFPGFAQKPQFHF